MMSHENSIIDQLYIGGVELVIYLNERKEISLSTEAETNFKKNLLLSAASYFEKVITDLLNSFAESRSNGDPLIIALISTKAIKRQYHTYFAWDTATNANSFFSHFGQDFKKEMEALVKADSNLDGAIKAFLQLGQERNKLVHQNFAEVVLDKTAEEIYKLYQTAIYFLEVIEMKLIPPINI